MAKKVNLGQTLKEISLETVLSSMVEGVIVLDMERKIVNINEAAARFIAVDLAKVVGKRFEAVIESTELRALIEDLFKKGDLSEAELGIPGEEMLYLEFRGNLLRDRNGLTVGVLIVLNDITRLKLLEKVRRDFVANVSHELKTPITSIKGFVETLLDGALANKDDAERFLRIVATQADRLHAIVEDLLTLARLEGEEERELLVLQEEPLIDVLQAAVEICRAQAKEKNIGMNINCEAGLAVVVDRSLLEQAVINLIDNAIKYSGPESTVVMNARQTIDEIVIEVIDRGPGIPDEHLARIFERFYRVDKARSRKLGGTGLGLAIVKHVASIHKGSVDVESRLGEGSNFSIHLPRT